MKKYRIALGCDHAGFEYKEKLRAALQAEGFEIRDYGTSSSESVDYPDFVHPLCLSIEKKEQDFGILICGSANGVAITANKHKGVRAAIAWRDDVAALARQHNDANVICLPARFISPEQALAFVMTFLKTSFEGGRHEQRVKKIAI